MGPNDYGIFKPVAETCEDCSRHVSVDLIVVEDGGEGVDGGETLSNCCRGGAMEDMLKVFMMEGGAARTMAIK
jgi:hypothetical protein